MHFQQGLTGNSAEVIWNPALTKCCRSLGVWNFLPVLSQMSMSFGNSGLGLELCLVIFYLNDTVDC